jgi:hypothetical protein
MNKFAVIRTLTVVVAICALSTCVFAADQAVGPIVINEIMASNTLTNMDPDSAQYADWIEIRNTGTSSFDLGGAFLTDDLALPQKWQIPSGITVPASGYLIIWADGSDLNRRGIHTNFKLNNGGEVVGLFSKTGAVLDTVTFKSQVRDVSYGRNLNSPYNWLYFEQATPGKANGTDGLPTNNQAAAVKISLASGFYSGSQTWSLSSATTATIHFTTDGSTPTRTSPIYTSPQTVARTTVVRTRAFEPSLLPGPVETRTFFINEQTTLPVFSLSTEPDNLTNDQSGFYAADFAHINICPPWERSAFLEFFEEDGSLKFSQEVDTRLFGNTAFKLPQKSLAIFLSSTLDYPLFNDHYVHEFKSLVLRSSSDDWNRTMFRDGFIQTMIRRNLSVDTQAFRPAIVFINGEYYGIHNIREKYNSDYLETHHGIDPNNIDLLYIDERQANPVTILDGDRQQYDVLMNFIDANSLASQANYNTVAGWVDIDNFIDYLITEIFTGNSSWNHNIRAWRTRTVDGKWQWVIFDLDRSYRDLNYNALTDMASHLPLFNSLLENAGFRSRFLQRYIEYLNDAFVPEKVIPLLDSLQAVIAPEMPNHIARWLNICGNGVCGIPSMTDWNNNVTSMRDIVRDRPSVARQQLVSYFNLNSFVQLDLQVQQPGYGEVQLGEKTTVSSAFSGQYYLNMPVTLKAVAHDGYTFSAWQESASSSSTLLSRGSLWKYFDGSAVPGAAWYAANFDDSGWKSGHAQLGYGDNDETTTIGYGPDSNNKYITSYYRTTFSVNNPATVKGLVFKLVRDDGAVVYLNGIELFRTNMPGGTVAFDTPASTAVGGTDESTFFEFPQTSDALKSGTNVVAVEIHQSDGGSSDVSFDLEIDADVSGTGGSVVSVDPELTLTMANKRSLTAVFVPKTQNVLPSEITTNMTLTAAGSPYLALGNVTVHANVTLTIQPGVEVQLAEAASLMIHGRLTANGSEALPITLRGINGQRWGALCFENTTGANSLAFVKINGATTGTDAVLFKAAFSTQAADVSLDHVTIENVGEPFYGHHGTLSLDHCVLDGTGANDDMLNIQYASARIENCYLFGNGELDFDFVDNGIIRNNVIETIATDPNRDGIDIGTSLYCLIENNRIFNSPDKGISVGEASTGTIIRGNLVVHTAMGVAVKDSSTATIDHNTFYSTAVGVALYEKFAGQGGGTAQVRNCIFSGSFDSEFTTDGLSSVQITYCASDKNLLNGVGNIKVDPHFISVPANNFYLQADSPCINAGDPTSPQDLDGTRSDMGAYAYYMGPLDTNRLYINELMADNSKTLADNAGEFDDWIEIYNGSDKEINIGGLFLTDDFNNPTLWRIPSDVPDSTTIQPKKFLLLWADNTPAQGSLHAGLKLNAGSERLALIKMNQAQAVFVDSITYGPQKKDISWGRYPDGTANWQFFSKPTPGSANDPQITDTTDQAETLPQHFMVHQNYPNPFNPTTSITFELPAAAMVTVEVYNSLGRHVARLLNESQEAGVHKVEWRGADDNGSPAATGVYFCRVTAGENTTIQKMILLR